MAFNIGKISLGEDVLPAFVAELGICHLGDVNRALKTVEQVFKTSGPCIVKTETFDPAKMVLGKDHPIISKIRKPNGEIYEMHESLLEHMERFQLTLEEHQQICEYVHSQGGAFLSTAHDFESIDFLVKIKADAIKIASPDIVHIPLLRYAGESGLPVILDTGGATRWEIARAVWTVKETNNFNILVNHHPGGHPAPAQGYGLSEMERSRAQYDTLVGTADHYHNNDMVLAAAALNADFIEKPVTLEAHIEEPEQIYATPVSEVANLRSSLEAIWYASQPQADKTGDRNAQGRMSFRAAQDLQVGQTVEYDQIWPSRPRDGIGVENWDQVKGLKIVKELKEGESLTWEHLG